MNSAVEDDAILSRGSHAAIEGHGDGGDLTGRVEIDRFSSEDHVYLEVFDQSHDNGKVVAAVVVLTQDETRALIEALHDAVISPGALT